MARSSSSGSSLHLTQYDAYGFDVDHTLAMYHLPELFQAFSRCLAQDLIDRKPNIYKKTLLREFNPDFTAMRGLIYDIKRGNFFKVSSEGTVLHASHGTRFMKDEEIRRVFGNDRHWERYQELLTDVDNLAKEIRIFENFFDTPIAMVTAHLVDYHDEHHPDDPGLDYSFFYQDLLDSIKRLYCDFPDSLFFQEWQQDTQRFLKPCSHPVKTWLRDLKDSGKIVFAVTSSVPLFMEASLKFILGEDWRTYFNLVVASSGKPKFFSQQKKQFKRINMEDDKGVSGTDLFLEGNSQALTEYIQQQLKNDSKPRVIYFGDSLRSDVVPVKKHTNWDVVMVLEELVYEQHEPFQGKILSAPPNRSREETQLMNSGPSEDHCLTSIKWGSYFRSVCKKDAGRLAGVLQTHTDDASTSMDTLWGRVLQENRPLMVVPSLDEVVKMMAQGKGSTGGMFYPRGPSVLQ